MLEKEASLDVMVILQNTPADLDNLIEDAFEMIKLLGMTRTRIHRKIIMVTIAIVRRIWSGEIPL